MSSNYFVFILQHVNHPGVVGLEKMFETPERVSMLGFSSTLGLFFPLCFKLIIIHHHNHHTYEIV